MATEIDSGSTPEKETGVGAFSRKVLVVIGLVAFAMLLWTERHVLLLLFAAVLIGVLLRSAARHLQDLLGLPLGAALALSAILLFAIMAGAVMVFGTEISGQVSNVINSAPAGLDRLRDWLGADRVDEMMRRMVPEGATIAGFLSDGLGIFLSALTGLILAVIGGLYLAANPGPYVRGTLMLLPQDARRPTAIAMRRIGTALRRWIVAQLAAMVAVGVLTFIGLTLIGLPSALALAVIAGVLEFVPLAGPILAAIPALLIAATVGMDMVLWTLLVNVAVQQSENHLLIPMLMRRAVKIPPATTLFALFLLGAMFGPTGVLLGGPLTVAFYVAIRELWVRDALGQDLDRLHEQPAAGEKA